MKYNHTSDINIKQNPESKIYYFVKGRIEESLRTTDWSEAKERKKLKEAEVEFSGTVARKFRVDVLYEEYRKQKELQRDGKLPKAKPIRPGTYREIVDVYNNHLKAFFGKKRLSQIDEVQWSRYTHSAKVSDLKNHRKVMGGFLKWCKRKKYLRALPDITEIPHHEKRHRRIIKPAELKEIFGNAQGSLLVFLTMALHMGLRRSEIMTLSWSNIDLNARFLIIEEIYNKKRRRRSLPMNTLTTEVLANHLRQTLKKGINSRWVFPNREDPKRHAHIHGLKTAWATCLRNSNLDDITWHDFRATFEKYMDKSVDHTDMQKEKFADATKEVRGRLYVTMDHDDLRGLESVVNVDGLSDVILSRSAGVRENDGRES